MQSLSFFLSHTHHTQSAHQEHLPNEWHHLLHYVLAEGNDYK